MLKFGKAERRWRSSLDTRTVITYDGKEIGYVDAEYPLDFIRQYVITLNFYRFKPAIDTSKYESVWEARADMKDFVRKAVDLWLKLEDQLQALGYEYP